MEYSAIVGWHPVPEEEDSFGYYGVVAKKYDSKEGVLATKAREWSTKSRRHGQTLVEVVRCGVVMARSGLTPFETGDGG